LCRGIWPCPFMEQTQRFLKFYHIFTVQLSTIVKCSHHFTTFIIHAETFGYRLPQIGVSRRRIFVHVRKTVDRTAFQCDRQLLKLFVSSIPSVNSCNSDKMVSEAPPVSRTIVWFWKLRLLKNDNRRVVLWIQGGGMEVIKGILLLLFIIVLG